MLDLAPEIAAPQAGGDPARLGPIAEAFHRGVLLRLRRRAGKDYDAGGDLFAFDATGAGTRCWQPETGAVLRALQDEAAPEALLHAALACAALGAEGEIQVELPAATRFSLAGQVFSAAGRVSLTVSGGEAVVASALGTIRLTRSGTRWTAHQAPDPALAWIAPGYFDHPRLSDRYIQAWVEPIAPGREDFIVDWPPPDYRNAALVDGAASQIGRALRQLSEIGPDYVDWIAPLFRGVAASPQKLPGVMQSGSYTWHAGVFSCGFPRSDAYLGEVMVHEISHQHFLLWNCVSPLVDKTTAQDAFSALKGRPRPLERVLLAFHATANMTLFWHDYVARFGGGEERDAAFAMMREHSADFVQELESAKGLTPAGRRLFEIQRDLLRERALCPQPA